MNLSDAFKKPFDTIEKQLIDSIPPDFPLSLREPIRDFLKMPSKKLRPLLALFASEAVGGRQIDALPAAAAVELFHDFTLIHDDIMDQDELRRGYPTLHIKYDDSTAILAGDALIGLAFQELLKSPKAARDPAAALFAEALVRVCEGQALDKEFESRKNVQLDEYLDMIAKKTAWLIQTACALGAICGGGNPEQVKWLSDFGYNLGMGFQIQDDLLDFVADEEKLGKKVGSDFRMHKSTYVTLKYRQLLLENPPLQANYPLDLQRYPTFKSFQDALQALRIIKMGENDADVYLQNALTALAEVIPPASESPLYTITTFLRQRQY